MDGRGKMRVTLVTDEEDLAVLRKPSSEIPSGLVGGTVYRRLAGRMVETVTAEEGVGIAGPQVGVSRRVVAVQRFDKEGEPFEVYPNIRIVATRGEKEAGPEGCLSVPDRRGDVLRWRDIDIAYTSPATLSDTLETVTGFTAVIFQHECDHLDGVIFTDRI
ncbi:MAG: peptide deformylase [Bacteroidales bacterium]|nr:peptide deformylase [Bacteroidales bacterium]